jgi:hypothetical protein
VARFGSEKLGCPRSGKATGGMVVGDVASSGAADACGGVSGADIGLVDRKCEAIRVTGAKTSPIVAFATNNPLACWLLWIDLKFHWESTEPRQGCRLSGV